MSPEPDITLVVTAFERPNALRQLLKSIDEFYPGIETVVVDNSREPLLLGERLGPGRKYCYAGFDIGLSASRNLGISIARTKYVAILEDDFVITAETRLDLLKKALDTMPDVLLASGSLVYTYEPGQMPGPRLFINDLRLVETGCRYEVLPRSLNPKWEKGDGFRYVYSEYVYNFFLARRVPELTWDEDLKVAIEHIAFFIEMKKAAKWRAVCVEDVWADHDVAIDRTPFYNEHRKRNTFWNDYAKKSGYLRGIDMSCMTVRDLEKARTEMTFPEYVFWLLRAQANKSLAEAKVAEIKPLVKEA